MMTKRQHYVPQFYLKSFVPEGVGIFWVYDKEGGEPRPQTPINTGVEGHLYTVLDEDGEKTDVIETDLLGPVDNEVAPVLQRWISGDFTQEDIPTMALFIAFQHVRIPRTITDINEIGSLMANKMAADMADDPNRLAQVIQAFLEDHPEIPPTHLESLASMKPGTDFELRLNRQVALGQSLMLARDVYASLLDMHWRILRFPEGGLPTCDSPVIPMLPDGKGRAAFGGGFERPDVQVSVPLSRPMCLHLDRTSGNTGPSLDQLTRRVARYADRFIITAAQSQTIATLVKEFAWTRNAPRIDKDALELPDLGI